MYQARKADVKLLKITLEIVLLKKNWCDKHTLNKQPVRFTVFHHKYFQVC